MNEYQILLFYKYVHIEDPEVTRGTFILLCEKYHLKGRLIIAREGINFTFEGKKEDTENFLIEMQNDERFKHIHFKRSVGTGDAFPKLSVKVRNEIVSAHLGTCDVDPNEVTGKHLPPSELHQWIHSGKEFYIVDMRNVYEHKIGKFAGSICPPLENFRDLPKIIKGISHLKNKTVVTVCTGGVRCEKASGYLITQGFTDVYQLDGGIVSYMEQFPNEDFEGKLYVFDSRVMMGFYTDDKTHKVIGTCEYCNNSTESYINCANKTCNKHILMCEDCQAKSVARHGKRVCLNGCKSRSLWGRIKKLWKK